MLAAHPELAIPPETGFLQPMPELNLRGDALRERVDNEMELSSFSRQNPHLDDIMHLLPNVPGT
jgi:hypothetical protein